MLTNVTHDIRTIAESAQAASMTLATLDTSTKNACLAALAARIDAAVPEILAANRADLETARDAGLGDAKLRRLALDEAKIAAMADGVRQVAALPDPVGTATKDRTLESGLHVMKIRCPIGVIMMIYEARPNVTVDAFALCFKAGNACILKGGREAAHCNEALHAIIRDVLVAHGVPVEAIHLITTSDRETIKTLLRQDEHIDLVIPRGGTQLIRFVHEHSNIPTVLHFHGVCHIYVDAAADLEQAVDVCVTAKTSAPAACNAVEAILVHADVAPRLVPELVARYVEEGVEVRGDETVRELSPLAGPAADDDWGREFLDLIVAMRVVGSADEAIEHIQRHGSRHTDAILTEDAAMQHAFTQRVQSSCVLVNASTRFNDGYQLGLGAEIGISTSRVHAFGPMGLEELTTQRYVVEGNGHCR